MLGQICPAFGLLWFFIMPLAIWAEDTARWLASQGHDDKFGARPLRRTVQHCIEDAAAEQLLEGKIGPGDRVAAAVCGDQVSLYRI